MKLITQLSGTLSDGDYREPRGALSTLHVEPKPGVHIKVMLGAAGLVFCRSDIKVALPLSALTDLVFAQQPEFLQTTAPSAPAVPLQAEVARLTAAPTKADRV